jgi:hypothetical protein
MRLTVSNDLRKNSNFLEKKQTIFTIPSYCIRKVKLQQCLLSLDRLKLSKIAAHGPVLVPLGLSDSDRFK